MQGEEGCGKTNLTHQVENLKVIVVRKGDGTYLAFADSCSHGGRELNYDVEDEVLKCSSFGHSTYDMSGNVLSGPAPTKLKMFATQQQGEMLHITLS
ncbi:MAG: ubiquinol-cytochrome c reductase iron-sulfur subunit [Bacteroidota bacterium]